MSTTKDQRNIFLFSGRVQGVGFRQTTISLASSYDVGGTVRNMSDGRVELILEGTAEDMGRLISEIKSRFAGFITDVTSHTEPVQGLLPPVRIIW